MNEEMYNIFLSNNHSNKQEKILLSYNFNVIEYIAKRLKKKSFELLELGVGKGYFAKSCFDYSKKNKTQINYSAFDRNKDMLLNLKKFDSRINTYEGELPKLIIDSNKKFDVVYCAFVVEHLRDGTEVYELISKIKKILTKDGIIIFFTPNALSQRFEFFNIDYTHSYPTTSRNITMAFNDCSITDVECLKINGLCTYKNFENTFVQIVHKTIFFFYSYRLLSIIFRPFYRVPLHRLDNFFYKVFCFFKEENLMFIARNSE